MNHADDNPGSDDGPESDDDKAPARSLVGRFWVFLIIAAVGGTVDLWSKAAIFRWRGLPTQSDIWWVWEPYFGIETAVNIGAVFGLGAGQGPLFAIMSVVAATGIVVWLFWFRAAESWWLTVALGMVGGGIIGNLYDRLGLWWEPGYPVQWKSGVRDWILWRINEQWTWPNFNIADSMLVVGAGMLLYQSFFPGQFEAPGPVSRTDPLSGVAPPQKNDRADNETTENETTENEKTENETTENEKTENEKTDHETTDNETTDHVRPR